MHAFEIKYRLILQFKQESIMNFLNKKYTSQHSHTNNPGQSTHNANHYNSPTNQKSFLPMGSYRHTQKQQNLASSRYQPGSSLNHTNNAYTMCQIHVQQSIRHMCTQCIQMLCSECISNHIQVHKKEGSFPTIHTIRQVRTQMNNKIESLMSYLNANTGPLIDLEKYRKNLFQKIQNFRRELYKVIDDQIINLKNQLGDTIQLKLISNIQQQMTSVRKQIAFLKQSLITSNNLSVVKKAYQLDADKLQDAYKKMNNKFMQLHKQTECQFTIDYAGFNQAFSKFINVSNRNKNVLENNYQSDRVKSDYSQIGQKSLQIDQNSQKIDQMKSRQIMKIEHLSFKKYLYNTISQGHKQSSFDLIELPSMNNSSHVVSVATFALNCMIIANDYVVLGGGIINQNQKSELIVVYDIDKRQIIQTEKMQKGRSSHTMLFDPKLNQVFVIGGFSNIQQIMYVQVFELGCSGSLRKLNNTCNWGGSCLAVLHKDMIIKISMQGIETMSLVGEHKHKWKEITSDVQINIAKGMKSQILGQVCYIFGNSQNYHEISLKDLDKNSSPIIKCTKSQIQLKNIFSSTSQGDTIYALTGSGYLTFSEETKWQLHKI